MKSAIKLLSSGNDAKTVKGEKENYKTAILYLAPARESGVMNVCAGASPGCVSSCLYTAGRSAMFKRDGSNPIREARVKKTLFLFNDRAGFMAQLKDEIAKFVKRCNKLGMSPAIRLNGTSDLPWHKDSFTFGLIPYFNDVQFYDYTKITKTALEWAQGKLPGNYHITYSRHEANHTEVKSVVKAGGNVAVVFSTKHFPSTYLGLPVVNGDKDDLRFLDPKSSIVGLKAKGQARKDDSGFVEHLVGAL